LSPAGKLLAATLAGAADARDAFDGVFAVDWNSSPSYINFIAFIARAGFVGRQFERA
jgi:hypothetical protein